MKKINFIDLAKQQSRIRDNIDAAIARVLDSGAYIMGPEVGKFENEIAEFTGAKYAISCSSGTDALSLALMALGVERGDSVLVPSFTFAATAETVALLGAIPVFVDCDSKTFNMSINDLNRAYDEATSNSHKVVGVIPVDLFGQPADYDAILNFAESKGIWTLSDGAQSIGGSYKNSKVGTIGSCTATSFFPAKPLGCYGDGGCVFTDDEALRDKMVSLRVHGKGTDKYDNKYVGLNARLDTIQAAILSEKLKLLAEEIELRNNVASYYSERLAGSVATPYVIDNTVSAWAQYTLILEEGIDRSKIAAMLKEAGIPSAVYYPKPLHLQTAYSGYHKGFSPLVNSDRLSQRVMSLPMHPYLTREEQDYIIDNFLRIVAR